MDPKHREIFYKNLDELVENTNNFDNLLNVMVKFNILNEKMVQLIKEKPCDKDKKREFYQLIPKRGPCAFKAFKEACFQTQNQPLVQITSPNRLFNQIDLANDQHSPIESYNMCSGKKGKALIINVESFEYDSEKRRTGSLKDLKELEELFKSFEFIVESHNNPTHETFTSIVKSCLKDTSLKDVNCFILVVMSHGIQDPNTEENVCILMHDNIYIKSRWIMEQMSTTKCPCLVDKPKLLLLTTCRSNNKTSNGVVPNGDHSVNGSNNLGSETDSELQAPPTMNQTEFKDILMVYPCVRGSLSFRNENGSWFIQHFIKIMKTFAYKEDMENMLMRVDQAIIKHANQSNEPVQILCRTACGFNRKLYFYPPHKWPICASAIQ